MVMVMVMVSVMVMSVMTMRQYQANVSRQSGRCVVMRRSGMMSFMMPTHLFTSGQLAC